jgi:hypothetical protein
LLTPTIRNITLDQEGVNEQDMYWIGFLRRRIPHILYINLGKYFIFSYANVGPKFCLKSQFEKSNFDEDGPKSQLTIRV